MLKPALTYFALVFGAGFCFGTIRTLWLAPSVGEQSAELIETPFMLLVVALAARFVVRRQSVSKLADRLSIGFLALTLLIVAELGVVTFVRQQSLRTYLAEREPVAGTVYLLALAFFALAPALVRRKE